MRNHVTDPAHRVAVLGERVRAMKVIWEQEEAEFHGKFVDFDPIYSWPKPVQRPHPPVLVGGWGPTTLSRVLDYGDAWMTPVGLSLAELREGMAELQRLADERGCSVPLVTTTKLAAEPSTRAEYEDLGVDRLLIAVSGASSDSALAELRAASSLL
jgi:alkanesulfonate monooxygenase SsuD/methylene tetrahydromethanopterin reductase-like flavin-dependent oxidoreductase (luciferase family)